MSAPNEEGTRDPTSTPARAPTSGRMLSCMSCQHRKVKCDRNHPCGNCVKAHVACVPVTQARPRRRRFPERELLDRLRAYEDLLRRNGVKFEPLHGDSVSASTPAASDATQENTPSPSTVTGSVRNEAGRIWYAPGQEQQEAGGDESDFLNDCAREHAIRSAWDGLFGNSNHLLFGQNTSSMDRSALHPSPIQVLRLWQAYLDNVNPILKVTHAPSLQGRIIEAAAGDIKSIDPIMEALMFGIYCIATSSLSNDECQSMLGMTKEDAMKNFQSGSQQSLLNCRFLQTTDRNCLTAYFLYLCAMRPLTDPRSLCPMIAIAVRIAQSMRLHREHALAKCTVFEAEMRRRLWWALVMFDTRIGQLAYSDSSIMAPTWDCRVPLNVNDIDLRPDMTELPAPHQGKGTDAVFAVVRGELADWVRNAPFHLDFTNPELKPIARKLPGDGDLGMFEARIEDEYLRHLDQGNPVHFMTTWTARCHFAKCHIIRQYSDRRSPQTDAQRDANLHQAFRMLDCDTRILASPMTKGYLWFLQFHFPFPAYLFIVQELRRRPQNPLAEQAWEVMHLNYEVRFGPLSLDEHPLMEMFAQVVIKAWETIQKEAGEAGQSTKTPKIVATIERKIAEREQSRRDARAAANDKMQEGTTEMVDGFPTPAMSMDFSSTGGAGFGGGYGDFTWMGPPSYVLGDMIASGVLGDVDMGQLDGSATSTRWG